MMRLRLSYFILVTLEKALMLGKMHGKRTTSSKVDRFSYSGNECTKRPG